MNYNEIKQLESQATENQMASATCNACDMVPGGAFESEEWYEAYVSTLAMLIDCEESL